MRTFHEFWYHPTPEEDIVRRAALDAVAQAQGEDFPAWQAFCNWDLGPGGAGMSRALFDVVAEVFRGLYPHIDKLASPKSTDYSRQEYASWASGGLFDKVTEERRKQIERGHDAEHDDGHERAELVMAALSYVLPFHMRGSGDEHMVYGNDAKPEEWPFDRRSWRPSPLDRKKELVKAMALLVAEHERLERQGP